MGAIPVGCGRKLREDVEHSKVLRAAEWARPFGLTRDCGALRLPGMNRNSPPKDAEAVDFPDFKERARESWGEAWRGAGSDELLDEVHGER